MEIALAPVAAEGVWYAPDFGPNRELPDEQRMAVRILPLTGRELKVVQAELKLSYKPKKSGDLIRAVEEREALLKEKLLISKIAEVRNLRFRSSDGSVVEVKDSKTLVETCVNGQVELLALLEDIFQAIMESSKLEEGLPGK